MIIHFLAVFTLTTLTLASTFLWKSPISIADAVSDPQDTIPYTQPVTTESRFTEKIEQVTEIIPKKEVTKDDPDTEIGTDTVLDEGADGKKIKTYKVTYVRQPTDASFCEHELQSNKAKCEAGAYYLNEEYSRELISTDVTPAKDKIISQGTKIVWRDLDTSDGIIKYWKKIHVWATQYDSHCLGCNDWTAIGLKAGFGVIAVDPSVIQLRSNVYIPGYGKAVAGDVGGAVRGNMIDVGFPDAHTSGWISHFVDIYLM